MFNRLVFPLLLCTAAFVKTDAQIAKSIFVADQTFKIDGVNEFIYAFAEGDDVQLQVQELTGKKLKSVELLQYPDYLVFRAYELDSVLTTHFQIPKTGVFLLRIQEAGLGKKVCRFTLHRTPGNNETVRFDTRVPWDIRQIPQYNVSKRSVQTSTRTELIALGGQVTVSASKIYLKKPVNAYQFTLPPNTVRWAYRIAVGQAAAEARRHDAEKLTSALQIGGAKMLGAEPETALAAFALGMAIDMTVSTAGEDVEYAIVDWDNWTKFSKHENYNSFLYQNGVSVDAQRRSTPLEGTYYFALRSDNWVDDINVNIDIEAVTEVPVFEIEWYLEPVRP